MRVGVDLGGTKIEIIALDESNRTLFRQRTDTPQGDYLATVQAIAILVHACETHTGNPVTQLGVGIPGAVSPDTGLIKNANSTCLIGQKLGNDLEKRLNIPIRLANDADCFTLSEAKDGAAKDGAVVFGVILGTGVGGGLVINHQPILGPNAITGEWGHNPLPWLSESDLPARPCYCGKQNCIETFLSGPGFSAAYNHARRNTNDTPLSAAEIWQLSDTLSPAKAAVENYLDQLARSLASVINIIDPDIIVFGGGMSNQKKIYSALPTRLLRYVFSDHLNTKMIQAEHGDSSGVRGAAWLNSNSAD